MKCIVTRVYLRIEITQWIKKVTTHYTFLFTALVSTAIPPRNKLGFKPTNYLQLSAKEALKNRDTNSSFIFDNFFKEFDGL